MIFICVWNQISYWQLCLCIYAWIFIWRIYHWKWKWGKDRGSISTCFTGWGRTSNNLICYLFIKERKEDSFCHLKSRALWITKLTKTLGFFMPSPNNEGDTTLSGRLRIRAVLNGPLNRISKSGLRGILQCYLKKLTCGQ